MGTTTTGTFLETAERHAIPFILFVTSYNVMHRIPFMWDVWEATPERIDGPSRAASYKRLYESM